MKIGIIGAGWWGKNLVRFFYELGVLKTVCDIDERTLNDIKVKYDEVKTTKNLGCFGDGGMVSTNDEEITDIIRCLIKHGGKDKYNVEHIGYNARLDTIQAAILLAKLKYVEEFNKKRREIANIYNENFKDIEEIETPADLEEAYNVYHQYTIKIRHCKRDEVKKYLEQQGISSMIYYPISLHKMKVFEGRCEIYGSLENSERLCKEVLSLPIEPLFGRSEIEYIVKKVKEFFKK